MLSYWEQSSFQNFDYAIIGGGIVGLSLAIELKQRSEDCSVLVIDSGLFPGGASIKNAGFACFGSLTEIVDDLETLHPDQVLNLVKDRYDGLQILIHRLGIEALGYYDYGGFDLLGEQNENVIERLDEVNELLFPLFNQKVFSKCNEQIGPFGFDKKSVKHLVKNSFEGQINTGWMMRALSEFAGALGIHILNNTTVSEIVELENGVELQLKNTELKISANQVGVCTNAFTKNLLPNLDLKPGRGQVLITEPIKDLPFKGSFHIESGYYYFRNVGNRVLFGGGRNLDLAGEATTEEGISDLIKQELDKKLRELILPGKAFEIESRWSGIMAFGKDKRPIVKQVSDRIYAGVRLGGMGVALGSKLGAELAELMLRP